MLGIEIAVLQCPYIDPVSMTGAMAKMTQRKIGSLQELLDLINNGSTPKLVHGVQGMDHGSVTRHSHWTVAMVGASRRFLAQARTHHVGIDWTSASLQYQDMRGSLQSVVPYPIVEKAIKEGDIGYIKAYKRMCQDAFENYGIIINQWGLDNDTAGYIAPQSVRNVLVATGNTEAWHNFIRARACNRNTIETQYTTLRIWQALLGADHEMFSHAGPDCMGGRCRQGQMFCGAKLSGAVSVTSDDIEAMINEKWPLLYQIKEIGI